MLNVKKSKKKPSKKDETKGEKEDKAIASVKMNFRAGVEHWLNAFSDMDSAQGIDTKNQSALPDLYHGGPFARHPKGGRFFLT